MMNKTVQLKRGAGILLPISSLPSPYGIGTLGMEGYKFVDFLANGKQSYWQVLPVGPTSFGDSPYQSFSAFAGNPYFIDLDILVKDGLLKEEEITSFHWRDNELEIDYALIFNNRFKILKTAFNRSNHLQDTEYIEFCNNNKYWIDDYSLYMALKFHFDNKEWLLWEEDIKFRKPEAVDHYSRLFEKDMNFWKFCQFHFDKQWKNLKAYANEKHIDIIGDIPLYISMDSADVWVNSNLFELDERRMPINVAGVPPDAFSDTGQRWGNPLYDWDEMEKQDFSWWHERMKHSAKLYNVIRIDHFIGIVRYYSIPSTCETAMEGEWRIGPGTKLTKVIDESIGNAKIIAEDLGVSMEEVKQVLKEAGYPGMKIIEFAFDSNSSNEHLPHNYTNNMVVYGGTHDNETLEDFFGKRDRKDLNYILEYLNVTEKKDITDAVIHIAYQSVACVAIFQAQDILKLDNRARMNIPSTVGTNWRWRLAKNQLTEEHASRLKKLANLYGR